MPQMCKICQILIKVLLPSKSHDINSPCLPLISVSQQEQQSLWISSEDTLTKLCKIIPLARKHLPFVHLNFFHSLSHPSPFGKLFFKHVITLLTFYLVIHPWAVVVVLEFHRVQNCLMLFHFFAQAPTTTAMRS